MKLYPLNKPEKKKSDETNADVMAGQSIKKKYLMCQISIKMLKDHTIPNSSLRNLKIYSSKGYRKTCQR